MLKKKTGWGYKKILGPRFGNVAVMLGNSHLQSLRLHLKLWS